MPDYAQPAGFRALLAAATLLVLLAFGLAPSPAAAQTAGISIVNGKPSKITDSPWQVAIGFAEQPGRQSSPRSRFFCGGSLITPELVITAAHCVADLNRSEVKQVEIISGRTRLNNTAQGTVVRARKSILPLRPNGKRRYGNSRGGASWDVGLIRLDSPLAGATIKLAGQDEADSWSPGQVVTTTGWGITSGFARKASPVLRSANQVVLPDRTCRRYDSSGYEVRTMNCIGGPAGNTSTCSGDSGGPLVASSGAEVRLVGLTSFGDVFCNTKLPSVDTRVSGTPIRKWVRSTALKISGIDVVGSGMTSTPARAWCSVPGIQGLRVKAARNKLKVSGCRLGRVKLASWGNGRNRRVLQTSYFPGWLAPAGTAINVLATR
ncbi:MAG: serine protease [Solirubrobacterales bacterium]